MNLRDRHDDRGISLVETIVAMTVLAVVLVTLTSVVLSSTQRIGDARVRSTGLDLARSTVEDIRAMPYEDIGIVAGAVPGTLAASTAVRVEGIDFDVRTDVEYVDDPVPGGFQSFADYKRVTVTVSPTDRDGVADAVLTTDVSPSGVSGKSDVGNVSVTVREIGSNLPDEAPTENLQLHLVDGPELGPVLTYGPLHDVTQIYGGLTPNPDVADTDFRYTYELRLGANVGATENGTYWMLPTDAVDSSSVRVLEFNTINREIRVYRPGQIELELRDPNTGDLIDDPDISVIIRTSGDDPDDPDADDPWEFIDVPLVGGIATITEFDQYEADPGTPYPLVPQTWWIEIRHATEDLEVDTGVAGTSIRVGLDGRARIEQAVDVQPGTITPSVVQFEPPVSGGGTTPAFIQWLEGLGRTDVDACLAIDFGSLSCTVLWFELVVEYLAE